MRPSVSWADGAIQVHEDYEQFVPELFACNLFSVATEGKALRYGSIQMPVHLWGPWRTDDEDGDADTSRGLAGLERAVSGLLAPATVLDILASFVLFATDKKKRRLKVVCRYQQYEAANRIVERVVAGQPKRGLIWHFQGSGKSLLMVFAAQKLRMHPALKNPQAAAEEELAVAWRKVAKIDDTAKQAAQRERLLALTTELGLALPGADVERALDEGDDTDLEEGPEPDLGSDGPAADSPLLNDRHNIIALDDEAHWPRART